jgi:ABC-type polysaccharide/polyol phosphate export permease
VSLSIAFAGAAINVYYRDVGAALPTLLSLLMYASPVIYPLDLVKNKLLVERAAGDWSEILYTLYTLNPLAGIIDSFQNVVLRGLPPDFPALILQARGVALRRCHLTVSCVFPSTDHGYHPSQSRLQGIPPRPAT